MKQSELFLLSLIFILVSCDEVNKVERKLSGTVWDIVLLESEGYYTGDRGSPAGKYDEWSVMDAGTYEFTDEPGSFGVDGTAKAGTLTLDYEYTLNGRTIRESETLSVDWYFLSDFLVIHNPEEFYYRNYSIDDFDKKAWQLTYGEGDGLGCSGYVTHHHIEKR